jgi:hypothetical protein
MNTIQYQQTLRHDASSMDRLLENEKERNKTESWNKLEKKDKVQKFIAFAEIWREKGGHSVDRRENLVRFLCECLEKNKLKNKKDIVYDKETMQIKSIPSLLFEDNGDHGSDSGVGVGDDVGCSVESGREKEKGKEKEKEKEKENGTFSLITDVKRISTLKSLTPKRI